MPVHLNELLDRYEVLEGQFPLLETQDKYSDLVRANGNQFIPIQRWFHLKEAYSLDLLETLLSEWAIPVASIRRILDPFCGVGTTLMASQKLAKKYQRHDLEAIGFERNPFLHFAARTKIRWHEYDPAVLAAHIGHLMNGAVVPGPRLIPPLATLHRDDIFDPEVLDLALAFKEAITTDLRDVEEQDPLLLGYASILEDISGVRKDGRALRVVANKQRSEIRAALEAAWNMIRNDIHAAPSIYYPVKTEIILGDGRTLQADGRQGPELAPVDLIIFSPPYLNNIDYTEVYKIELWMCGFIETQEQFRAQRLRTLRSHPSIQFPDPVIMTADTRMAEVCSILDQLIAILPNDRYLGERTQIFRGYFDDMYQSLSSLLHVLAPGGWLFCVVGNSLHGPKNHAEGRIPVASDLLIAQIATCLGLEVKGVQIARHLTRRLPVGHYVRETILVMQKPA